MHSDNLTSKIQQLLPHLDERQRRLYLASEAGALSEEIPRTEAIIRVSEIARCSIATLYRGIKELEEGTVLDSKTRLSGGGRKAVETLNPQLAQDLKALVAPETRGDPESPLIWTTKSTWRLADTLNKMGHQVSPPTVARLLKEMGYSLQANQKTKEGGDHPDRDAQFVYVNSRIEMHQTAGNPVISVDCKKKELVGDFKNSGRELQPKGQPEKVRVYDFEDKELGKAIPYGIYDITKNEGFVNVGSDHDTSAFAVESIRRWWKTVGKPTYPEATELLIVCDGGGSNDSRRRQWKYELAQFATEEKLTVNVSHLPPGTSKWNKIEHRLFSHISMGWRGRPLVSHEVVVNLIGAVKTKTGLKVTASRDESSYPLKIKISDEQMAALPITRDEFRGNWNYSLHPLK